LAFVGFGAAQRAVIESLNPRRIEVLDLNLEDAFIEYTRGPRRALPVFFAETFQVIGGQADESIGSQGAA
jgi:ABC-2 type transport system ATP-binding protein